MQNLIRDPHRLILAALILVEALYSLSWVILVILNRGGIDIAPLVGPETARSLLDIALFQDVLLLTAASSVWTSFILLANNRRGALMAYLFAVLFSKADWVMMALQSFERMGVEGYISLIFQILVLSLFLTRRPMARAI